MTGLQGDVTVPVVGRTKKAYVAIAGAAVAGLVGYAYWRRRQDQGAQLAPDGSDGGLYVDTRTGSALPTDTFTNPAPNADGQSGTGIGGDSLWQAPHTDQEWAQQAVERLSWYEPGFVSAVVGKYLARQPITAEEAGVIRELWGLIGHPPTNQLIVPAATQTPAPVPTPKPTPTPTPKPTPAPAGIKVVNARVTGTTQTMVVLDWAASGHPDSYRIYVNGALKVNTTSTGARIGGFHRATTYSFGIVPVKAGKAGPTTTIRATTKK